MPKPPQSFLETPKSFATLIEIIRVLRAPDGCPWDKEQTHRSLTPYVIEEAHELAEAIESGTQAEVIDELGDVLLQVMLHSEIARQAGRFDISDVIQTLNEKMVRRHPHVFDEAQVANSEAVLDNWAEIKKAEKASRDPDMKFDVPLHLPALSRAQKIGSKTKAQRFDWTSPEEVFGKVDEEIRELKEAVFEGNLAHQEHELGDVLFSLAQLARHLKLESEQSLRVANQRFEKRFFTMKRMIEEEGQNYEALKPQALENYWRKVKDAEKSSRTSGTRNNQPETK